MGGSEMYPEDHDPNTSSQGSLARLLFRMRLVQWLLGKPRVRTVPEKETNSDDAAGEFQCKELADAEISNLREKALISSMLHATSSRWKGC